MTKPISHYISADLERVITIALMNLAADETYPPNDRDMATDYAYALQNDTWLLETTDSPID